MGRLLAVPGHTNYLRSNAPMPTASEITRMTYRPNGLKFQSKTPGELAARIGRYLREKHPRKTADEVCAETGISTKTVRTWLSGSSVPGGVAFVQLTAAYGLEFLGAALPEKPEWLDKATVDRRIAELEAGIEAQRRELEALTR